MVNVLRLCVDSRPRKESDSSLDSWVALTGTLPRVSCQAMSTQVICPKPLALVLSQFPFLAEVSPLLHQKTPGVTYNPANLWEPVSYIRRYSSHGLTGPSPFCGNSILLAPFVSSSLPFPACLLSQRGRCNLIGTFRTVRDLAWPGATPRGDWRLGHRLSSM